MYSRLCLGRSVLSNPFPWRRDFLIPYSFLNVYWPFRNSDSSVPAVAEWQCRSHCVFSFYVKVGPLPGNVFVDTLTGYCLVIT
jgi:hypothetical protein